jgi:hypothetical protein
MRLRRWKAGKRFTNRDRDDVCVVIQPQSGQRNDVLLVTNKSGDLAMKIDADGDVWFPGTVGFWNAETQQYERMVTGRPES